MGLKKLNPIYFNMWKSNIKTRMFLIAIVSIAVGALVAHALIPFVAILAGLVAGLGFAFGYLKYINKKTTIFDVLAALAGSQIGWVALLI